MPVAVLQERMTQASRKGTTYLRRRSESLDLLPAVRSAACARDALHLFDFEGGLLGSAGTQQRGVGPILLAALKEPAGRFGDQQTAEDEEHARRQRHPEDAAPGLIFERKSAVASPSLATASTR